MLPTTHVSGSIPQICGSLQGINTCSVVLVGYLWDGWQNRTPTCEHLTVSLCWCSYNTLRPNPHWTRARKFRVICFDVVCVPFTTTDSVCLRAYVQCGLGLNTSWRRKLDSCSYFICFTLFVPVSWHWDEEFEEVVQYMYSVTRNRNGCWAVSLVVNGFRLFWTWIGIGVCVHLNTPETWLWLVLKLQLVNRSGTIQVAFKLANLLIGTWEKETQFIQ